MLPQFSSTIIKHKQCVIRQTYSDTCWSWPCWWKLLLADSFGIIILYLSGYSPSLSFKKQNPSECIVICCLIALAGLILQFVKNVIPKWQLLRKEENSLFLTLITMHFWVYPLGFLKGFVSLMFFLLLFFSRALGRKNNNFFLIYPNQGKMFNTIFTSLGPVVQFLWVASEFL